MRIPTIHSYITQKINDTVKKQEKEPTITCMFVSVCVPYEGGSYNYLQLQMQKGTIGSCNIC